MQSDLILTVPNPIDQYIYYFGVLFRPKQASAENPEVKSWDGWLIKFKFDAKEWETPNSTVENLWLEKLEWTPKIGVLDLHRDDGPYKHLANPKVQGQNYCELDDDGKNPRNC